MVKVVTAFGRPWEGPHNLGISVLYDQGVYRGTAGPAETWDHWANTMTPFLDKRPGVPRERRWKAVTTKPTDGVFMTTRAGSTQFDWIFREAFIRPGSGWENWGTRSNITPWRIVRRSWATRSKGSVVEGRRGPEEAGGPARPAPLRSKGRGSLFPSLPLNGLSSRRTPETGGGFLDHFNSKLKSDVPAVMARCCFPWSR